MEIAHGNLPCVRCWPDHTEEVQHCGPFQLTRKPGHWGASNPSTLVLGMSAGATQMEEFRSGSFDRVAFKGFRDRLLQALQAVGVLVGEELSTFERRLTATEIDFGFSSILRCSITAFDPKRGVYSADSPKVLPAFRIENTCSRFAQNCVDQFLVNLPSRTKTVILLGNANAYVEAIAGLIGEKRGALKRINPVAYESAGVLFVHIAHPSRANGHFGPFVNGEGGPGRKRDWARSALASRE